MCSSVACVHYVASTADAPDPTDVDINGVPDYVDEASAIVDEVWQAEVDTHGYRAPKSDITSTNDGGDAKLDVYLKNIGSDGIYGYCTSDDPNVDDPAYQYWDVSAYCVIDDDFSPAEFPPPSANGSDALKVTVAHEFFHAVQFGYDWAEDVWILEGTATWMEEQVYDQIDDNRQYLPASPLARPSTPLDRGAGGSVYGNWIFWQFLAEYFADPSIVFDVWAYADGSAAGPDAFSSHALGLAIGDRSFDGTIWRFRWAFADFGAANAAPRAFYAEGQAGSYPAPPASKSVRLSRSRQALGRTGFVLDHMTNRFVVVKRGRGIGETAKLAISIDGPRYSTGTEASAVVFRTNGAVSIIPLRIASDGDARRRVAFGKGAVAKVTIVLTNASSRFRNCWANSTPWSCSGVPRDDDMRYVVAARVV